MAIELSFKHHDDSALAAKLAAQDPRALAVLYNRYFHLAYSVSVRIVGDPGKAEDVCQEVFLKLWNNAHRFDPARGSFRTWLVTAVRNRSIDYSRGNRNHERQEREIPWDLAMMGAESDPFSAVAHSVDTEVLWEALETLPPKQRQAVVLVYLIGYKQREVAEMIGVPKSTIKGRSRLGLERLRDYLASRGIGGEASQSAS